MTMLAEHTERPTVVDPQDEPRAVRPRWVRPALGLLLAVTALLYLWGLDAAGWANEYYAAAVQAGTQSWKALLFGSIDAGNAITVDKPPAALWVMALSGRIFGFGTLSMLVPSRSWALRPWHWSTARCAASAVMVPACWPEPCWR